MPPGPTLKHGQFYTNVTLYSGMRGAFKRQGRQCEFPAIDRIRDPVLGCCRARQLAGKISKHWLPRRLAIYPVFRHKRGGLK